MYLCGCIGEEVGQTFDRVQGVMVCPEHGQGFAPHDSTERFYGRLTLTLDIETATRAQAERWLDVLCATMELDDTVRAILSSLEQRGGKL